jgi:hypothetical protein
MKRIINHLQDKNHFSIYLSLFRIFICFHLLKDIANSWGYLDILYSNDTFIAHPPTMVSEILGVNSSFLFDNHKLIFSVYIGIILLFLFGIGRNFTALLLFLMFELIQRMNHLVLNGGDNLLKFILLYFIFADSFKYFTLFKRTGNEPEKPVRTMISNLAVYSICFHVCLAYLWSAFHKIHADTWFNGAATYYTFQIERFKGTGLNTVLAKNGLFVTLSTYATLFFEIFFPVLIWFKQTRTLFVIGGALMHIGIYVFMMIYDFEIIFMMSYGFFYKDADFKRWYQKIANRLTFVRKLKTQLA